MVFSRLKTGLTLTVDSLKIIRNNPTLLVFPLVSGIAGLLFLVVFLGISFGVLALQPDGAGLVVLFVVYLGLTFISSFFAAALVHETRDVIRYGSEPDLRDGIDGAWEVRKPLFIWAAISATVGIVINALENSDSRVARIFSTIFSVAWTLMTFFVVPVIVFEKPSPGEMFSRSAGTFKQTWGETPISLIGVQLVSVLIVLPAVALGVALASVSAYLAIGLILVGVLLGFLVSQTLQGVVKTTLYVYATEGKKPDEFENVQFDQLNASEGRRTSSRSIPNR